jgi:fructose-bisphosphate aldolase/6-deoxy-5-ketofructose 1-phosphate synthase
VTEKLFLFAADQKIEHLNKDFYGNGIPDECADPEHLFKIASQGKVGAFATQLGLISKYGQDYKDINYIVKLNSKTNLVSTEQMEPISLSLNFVSDVVDFKKRSNLKIVGVGYTIYLGSEHEPEMLSQAAQVVYDAQIEGLMSILWIYPRGKAIKDEYDPDLLAGAAGVACALGADFVKINPPKTAKSVEQAALLKRAVAAAGRTKVICSGGAKKSTAVLLQELHDQMHLAGTSGCAVGRNIFQRSLPEAVKLCEEIHKVIADHK